MTQTIKLINIGSQDDAGTGDSIRGAFQKINENYAILAATSGAGGVDLSTVTNAINNLSTSKASISYVNTVVSSSTGSLATALQTLQTSFNELNTKTSGSYTNLVSLISNATGTIATRMTTLEAKFTTLTTGTGATISYVDTAIANSTSSFASSLQSLQTSLIDLTTRTDGSYTNLISIISTNAGTVANSIQALQASLTNLTTKTNGSYTNLISIIANSTGSISTSVSNLEAKFATLSTGTGATISYVNTAIANSTSSLASSVQTLQTSLNNLTIKTDGSYTNLVSIISNNAGTIGTRVSTLEARVTASTATLATISYVNTVVATSTSSLASSVQTLTSTVGAATASVSTLQSTVNGITGQYGVTINTSGAATGFKILGGAATSSFVINATNFQITGSGINPITPFSVNASTGKISMSGSVDITGSIAISAAGNVGWLLNAGVNGTTVSYRMLSGYNINAGSLSNPGAPAVTGIGIGNVGVYGYTISNSFATAHGVRGQAISNVGRSNPSTVGGVTAETIAVGATTSGIVGASNGYDFYADGAGTNYGPFTGAHDAIWPNDTTFQPGDIVIDAECKVRNGWSNTLFRVELSSRPNQKAVLGVLAQVIGPMQSHRPPAVFIDFKILPTIPAVLDDTGKILIPEISGSIEDMVDPLWEELAPAYQMGAINALGEGQMNVCGEGGNLEAGDLIVSSSMPGKGMKQADDIVRSYTVAKSRENVVFSDPSEVKIVACIYVCG